MKRSLIDELRGQVEGVVQLMTAAAIEIGKVGGSGIFAALVMCGMWFGIRGAAKLISIGGLATIPIKVMAEGISLVLRGVELLLLAGLLLLFVSFIGDYIGNIMSTIGESFNDKANWQRANRSLAALMSVKRLTVALLASLVATHMVGEVLQSDVMDGLRAEGMALMTWVFQAVVLVLLLAFLLIIDRREGNEPQNQAEPTE